MQDRRKFIKQTCTLCVAAVGFSAIVAELESCKTTGDVATNPKNILVALKDFGDKQTLVVDSPKVDYKIFLVKKSSSEFLALRMVCTHKANPVQKDERGLYCPSHGSEFDLDGNVTKGPAGVPLKRLPVILHKASVEIAI